MKTMTCRQLGGPCDYRLQGDTADAVIKKTKHTTAAAILKFPTKRFIWLSLR